MQHASISHTFVFINKSDLSFGFVVIRGERMFGWFSKKKNKAPEQKPVAVEVKSVAPGTGISFKPDLIKKYSSDHQELLGLYGQVAEKLQQQEFSAIPALLKRLQDALRAHLLDENLNFYIYMQHCYKADEDNLELISEYRREMTDIGRTAFSFLKQYGEPGADVSSAEFRSVFDQIGEVLTRRIDAEENYLYPLYRHPDEFAVL
ncbi:hemerythrin domain-containing protein [Pelagibaculum spongiae]|nr:hemerythrin domain-containing protein [Pelagibaculum spongiae]